MYKYKYLNRNMTTYLNLTYAKCMKIMKMIIDNVTMRVKSGATYKKVSLFALM